MDQNELYHFGIKGQKWGIRRYQYADGSLTPAGKRKYGTKSNFEKVQAAKKAASGSKIKAQLDREKANARTQAEIEKYHKKAAKKLGKGDDQEVDNKEKKTDNEPTTKTKAQMSNEELRAATDRMNLERNYVDAQRNYIVSNSQLSALQPQKVSKGKEFTKGLWNDVVRPAATNVGKQWLEKTLKDITGLNNNPMAALEKAAKKADLEKKIYEAEAVRLKNEDSALKNKKAQLKFDRDEDERKKNKKEAKANAKAEKKEAKANAKAEKEADNKAKQETKTEKEKVYSGKVFGEGTSKYTEKSKFDTSTAVDGEFREIHKTDINHGQNFVNSILQIETKSNNLLLLEDKRMKHSEIGGEIMDQNELYHFGIKGQKWGVRRYQNPDGSLTSAGKKRAYKQDLKNDKKQRYDYEHKAYESGNIAKLYNKKQTQITKKYDRAMTKDPNMLKDKTKRLSNTKQMLDEATKQANDVNDANIKQLKQHVDSMIKKYSNTKIKDVNPKTLKDGTQFVNTYMARMKDGGYLYDLMGTTVRENGKKVGTYYVPYKYKTYAYAH